MSVRCDGKCLLLLRRAVVTWPSLIDVKLACFQDHDDDDDDDDDDDEDDEDGECSDTEPADMQLSAGMLRQ